MEVAWPHLSIVYEFLLHVVQASDVELAYKKKFIDSKWVGLNLGLGCGRFI